MFGRLMRFVEETAKAHAARLEKQAIRMADAAGITLAALLRGHSVNLYSRPERVGSPDFGAVSSVPPRWHPGVRS